MGQKLIRGFTFDDVLLIPQFSDIESRSKIDLSQEFLGVTLRIPIVSANMDYVTDSLMANAMWKAGGFGILHRFYAGPSSRFTDINLLYFNTSGPVAFSVGLNDPHRDKILEHYYPPSKFTWITIDVAHGHHGRVMKLIGDIKIKYPRYKVIAGNVATAEGFYDLVLAGADAIKVGIGPGSVCTTRLVTGVGVPQLSAIMAISEQRDRMNTDAKIIADGGIRNSGDIVKALAAGADIVMLGSLLAGTDEAPAPVLAAPDGRKYKAYRGQSIFGSNSSTYIPEGIAGYVPTKGPVAGVLRELEAGIRSGFSYVGANNISELQRKATFMEVSSNSLAESSTRVLQSVGG